jgi:5-methylcytosine-specific restriction endonuclease McrA
MPDTRTYADRREYLKEAVKKRRKFLREKAREYGGGKCMICGYTRCSAALDFHHIDSRTKEFGLSVKGLTRSWEKMKEELDKCVLICANCHREVHAGMTQLPRETLVEKRGEFGETLNRRKSVGQSRAKPARKRGKV